MNEPAPVLVGVDARGVASITLNRPERHNALDPALVHALQRALDTVAGNSSVRVVVLRAAGRSFCAGMDLDHMRRMGAASEEENVQDAFALSRMLRSMYELPKPVVACVQGSAFGGGIGLIACADIAIGSEDAKFSLSEARLGLIPAVISPFVTNAIGLRAARRWFLNAAQINASEAHEIGLLHIVTAAEDFSVFLERELSMLLKGGPQAQREAKRLLLDSKLAENRDLANARMLAKLRSGPEASEGVNAFFEKRAPKWDRS